MPAGTDHSRRVQARLGLNRLALGCPQHARGLVQFFFCEEAGLTLAHSQRRSAVYSAIIVKEEQADLALAGVAVHMDVVAKRVAGPGQAAVVGQVATEKAVAASSLVECIDAQVRDEEEVGLACLDHDPRGHESAMQEPRIVVHVGLGPHAAQAHRPGHCMEAHHPIGKQQGRLGHAHLDRVFVLRFELGTEQVRYGTCGVNFQIAAREGQSMRLALFRRKAVLRAWLGRGGRFGRTQGGGRG